VHVVFKYSLLEEVRNILDLIIHKKNYKNLRSVIFPTLSPGKEDRGYIDSWKHVEPEFNKALLDAGLKLIEGDIICFTHKFGCEGWFNIDKNQIHIRTTHSTTKNTIDSIMHELLHLITYKPDMSYPERETLVDKYMNLESVRQLLNQ